MPEIPRPVFRATLSFVGYCGAQAGGLTALLQSDHACLQATSRQGKMKLYSPGGPKTGCQVFANPSQEE
jgi:hypothetical protein